MTAHSTATQVVKGWHVLTAMIAFFGAIIAVNIGFTVMALGSFPGEDVRRSYLQGLNYNDALAERRAQVLNGWRASTELRPAGAGAELVVVVRNRAGAAVDNLEIAGELRWPARASLDRALIFEARGAGVYVAALEPLPAGIWRLRARASGVDGGALDFESELPWRMR